MLSDNEHIPYPSPFSLSTFSFSLLLLLPLLSYFSSLPFSLLFPPLSIHFKIADLSDLKDELLTRVTGVVSQAAVYRGSYGSYSYLWVDDRQEFLSQFLLYGHMLTQEEIEQAGDEGVPENPPTLIKFKKQVDSYEAVYLEVEKFDVRKLEVLELFVCHACG